MSCVTRQDVQSPSIRSAEPALSEIAVCRGMSAIFRVKTRLVFTARNRNAHVVIRPPHLLSVIHSEREASCDHADHQLGWNLEHVPEDP